MNKTSVRFIPALPATELWENKSLGQQNFA